MLFAEEVPMLNGTLENDTSVGEGTELWRARVLVVGCPLIKYLHFLLSNQLVLCTACAYYLACTCYLKYVCTAGELPKQVTKDPSVNHIGSSDEPPITYFDNPTFQLVQLNSVNSEKITFDAALCKHHVDKLCSDASRCHRDNSCRTSVRSPSTPIGRKRNALRPLTR